MNIQNAPGATGAPPAIASGTTEAAGPPRRTFIQVLGEARTPAGPALAKTAENQPPSPKASVPKSTATWRSMAQDAIAVENRIDNILKSGASGKTFSPAELLSMQAEVFRYSQTVEVLSRVTDKLVGAVKQTLSTQV